MMKTRKEILLMILACLLSIPPATAKVWYVGTWTGKPQEDVKATFSEAYAAAADANDEIWIAAGTYTVPSITLSKSKVSVYGGFAGTETSIDQRAKTPGGKPWEFVSPTVFNNSGAQIFSSSTGSNSIVVDGIIFDGEKTAYRRAMNLISANTSTSHRISNCIIRNYLMNGDGAGFNIRCKADIYDCLITGNENTGNVGGGAYLDYAVTMYRCEITGNKSGNNGGGVQANGLQGVISLYNCRIENNTAVNSGGGVYGNQMQMHDCIIVNNTAGTGGGIALDARKASTVWNVTVANNKATKTDGAGGVSFYENYTHANAVNVNVNQHIINTILWNNKDAGGQMATCVNAAGNTANKTNGKLQNCIIDGTAYPYLTFVDNVIATDSAALFDNDWLTLATAPTVDAGTLLSGASMAKTDYAGNTRIMGASVDIGPYENQDGEPWVNPNKDAFDGMMEIIRNEKESVVNIAELAESVATYVYNPEGVCNVPPGGNGFFPDIDYSDKQGNAYNWKATAHLNRLINMAYVYTMQGSPKQGDSELYSGIVAGINAWMQTHPAACSNWWYNQIAEPQRLGTLLIQMRKGATPLADEVEGPVLTRMLNPSLSGYPGSGNATSSSNITNVAEHCIYSALLSYDEGRLITMLDQFVYPAIKISTGITADGIKPDKSHFMHGRVLYIGGYGEELIKNVTFFSLFTAGTKYAMPEEKVDILSDFVRNTWQKTIRGRYMLWDVTGRGVSRIGEMDKLASAVYPERMKAIDPGHADEYDAAIKRIRGEEPVSYQIEPLSRQHFIADHTLHIRPGYTFDVNFVSTRTQRIEWGNGENKKALYMSDGCTNIVRRGDEYATIQGTWNWARVPGITCLQTPDQTTDNPGSTISVTGTSTFAGGVTDSLYSVTAYYYPSGRVNLSAKKGWFMFDDEIVCLGASITAASGNDAYDSNTTLNQCNLNTEEDVVVSENGNAFLPLTSKGEHVYATAPKWVLHDSTGYVFPAGGNVVVSNQLQSGNWYDINNNGVNAVVNREVFSLWFNHGKQVTNGSYAYIIVPDKTAAEMQDYYASGNVEILANNDSVQAVYHKALDIWGLIFYKAASFTDENIAIKANKNSVLLLKRKDGHYEMHIADPAQAQTQINVQTRIPSSATQWVNTLCDFADTGDYRGASKAYIVPESPSTGMKPAGIANDPVISVKYYDLMGKEVVNPTAKGIYIIQKIHQSGKKVSVKTIR
jgi:chondroitin AC lyase